MSNTIYSIKYDNNSFFSSNPNVDITFPFGVNDVIQWAKQTSLDPYLPSEYNTDNLFDEKLSDVIISNKDAFINIFLVGNAYFNSDFNNIVVSTEIQTPEIPESDLPTIDVNGVSFTGTSITSRNGSTSYVIGNPGFQRVNFQPRCTLNHIHFPGENGCSVQEITNSQKETYYKCVCSGTPVFDSNPHAHCSEFTNNIKNPQTAYNTSYSSKAAESTMMTPTRIPTTAGGTPTPRANELNVDYSNADGLKDLNLFIREIIYMYYKAVNENVQYRNAIEKQQKSIDTQELALTDSTVKYKKEYLTAFNLLSGIIIVCGYIYGMNKV